MLCSKLSQSSMGPDIKGKNVYGKFPSHLTNSRHFVPRAKIDVKGHVTLAIDLLAILKTNMDRTIFHRNL